MTEATPVRKALQAFGISAPVWRCEPGLLFYSAHGLPGM